MPASEVIFDTPIEFPQPDSSIWSPSNFTNDFRGPVTIRDALAASINVVAVKVGLRVGLETVAKYAHRMGITEVILPKRNAPDLDDVPDDEIVGLNIPTGIPLIYELEDDLTPIRSYYLGDQEAIKAAQAAVAAQGKAK